MPNLKYRYANPRIKNFSDFEIYFVTFHFYPILGSKLGYLQSLEKIERGSR